MQSRTIPTVEQHRLIMRSVVAAICAIIAVPLSAQHRSASAPYEVVRGAQLRLCRDLAKNLNRFAEEPPQVCRRKFDSALKDFRLPNWRQLPADQARLAALAIVPSRWPEDAAKKLAQEVEDAAANGKLQVWEAQFDLARSGERVRVALVSRGICRVEHNYSYRDPVHGVLLPDRFEIDERYEGLTGFDGDLFFYRGLPYIANWHTHPGAVGRGPAPRKNHHGYLMVFDTFWLRPGYGASHDGGTAGSKGPICQIGYQRLSGAEKEGKQ